MGLDPGNKFVLVDDKDGILLKNITEDEMKDRFRRLISRTSAQFRRAGITRHDVDDAVRAVRSAR